MLPSITDREFRHGRLIGVYSSREALLLWDVETVMIVSLLFIGIVTAIFISTMGLMYIPALAGPIMLMLKVDERPSYLLKFPYPVLLAITASKALLLMMSLILFIFVSKYAVLTVYLVLIPYSMQTK